MALIEPTTENDSEDQAGRLDVHIEESVTYYIICDECHGCYDLKTDGIGIELRDQGWRIRENERGREYVFCPKSTAQE